MEIYRKKIAEGKKKIPSVSEKEVWELFLAKDEEGNYVRGIGEAVLISCVKNLTKEKQLRFLLYFKKKVK